jgi:hypothetical protein
VYTNTPQRRELTLALERFRGNDHGRDPAILLESLVRAHTSDFTDETCAALASSIYTKYEQPVMDLINGGFDNFLADNFVRLLPDHTPNQQRLLSAYFKDLQFHRAYPLLSDVDNDSLVNLNYLVLSAREYRAAMNTLLLPATTHNEHLLINFLDEHPHLKDALTDRLATTDDISQELLDQLIGHQTLALIDGLL